MNKLQRLMHLDLSPCLHFSSCVNLGKSFDVLILILVKGQ